MHEVLVNRLGGLSLPRKSVVRLTDRPDMTLDVYRGRKTTIQQYNNSYLYAIIRDGYFCFVYPAAVILFLRHLTSCCSPTTIAIQIFFRIHCVRAQLTENCSADGCYITGMIVTIYFPIHPGPEKDF